MSYVLKNLKSKIKDRKSAVLYLLASVFAALVFSALLGALTGAAIVAFRFGLSLFL